MNSLLKLENVEPQSYRKMSIRRKTKFILLAGLATSLAWLGTPQHKAEQRDATIVQSMLVSPNQAAAIAINNLTETPEGFLLNHPSHRAEFTEKGVFVQPRRGELRWHWQLQSIMGTAENSSFAEIDQAKPQRARAAIGERIEYNRGAVTEQYILKKNSIEQQFIIAEPLPELKGKALTFTGKITCNADFETTESGWRWRNDKGQVTLGDVTVFDATGAMLPATMHVSANETRIEIDGTALTSASYPVTIDPEIGANDFRISDMGPDGNDQYDAANSAVAYNSQNNEYLVVWGGDDDTGAMIENEYEIFGQRIDATSGAEIGVNDFRISDMGPDGDSNFRVGRPAIAYNSMNNEYLVVWEGTDDRFSLAIGENEIFGQRIDAGTGAEVGANDFRISDLGSDGDANFDALAPSVTYNSVNNEYFVVWYGDDDPPPLVNDELEIFGQRINAATGAEIGVNDFRISDMGSDGNTMYIASSPDVSYNSSDNEYFVVWNGDDDTFPLVNNETEIFGQRIDATSGVEIGSNDFRISDMGTDGSSSFWGSMPKVAYNSTNNEYLVVWLGDDGTPPLGNDEREIFGQLFDAAGTEIGTNDFRISDMGPDGTSVYLADNPDVEYSSQDNEYLVVWHGDDDTPPLVDEEHEIFAQRIDADTGAEIGINDFRLSDMGPDGNINGGHNAFAPALAYNQNNNEFLITWQGTDDTPTLVQGEQEIFGQRYTNDFVSLSISNLNPPPPTTLPPGGGTISFSVSVRNNDSTPMPGDFWAMAELPNGNQYGPLFTMNNVTLPPGVQLSGSLSQPVPAGAPPGTYKYILNFGTLSTNTVVSSVQFSFSKSVVKTSSELVVGQHAEAPSGHDADFVIVGEWPETIAAAEASSAPSNYALHQNYPNPFNPSTMINYQLPMSSFVELAIYDVQGQLVRRLVAGQQPAGSHSALWDATDNRGQRVPSGVYVYRLRAGAFETSRKLLLLK